MPNEDAFFDEIPINENPRSNNHLNKPSSDYSSVSPQVHQDFTAILDSAHRQERLLERIVGELEKMNRRLSAVERLSPTSGLSAISSAVAKGTISPTQSPTGAQASKTVSEPRGHLVLPPGSRSAHTAPIPNDKKPVVSAVEEEAAREKQELEVIERRRAEEVSRLARIEAERLEREAEEERKRLAELKRIEEEKHMKEELEKKTRGLMTDLLTGGNSGGGLFANDELDDMLGSKGGKKKSGGLFDD